MADYRVSLRSLLVVPTVLTLAVTLLRLTGELLAWSPKLFARSAGGGASLVGIVWLIPVFGVYFALRLAQSGEGPPTVGRALGRAALGFVVNTALFVAVVLLFPKAVLLQLAVFALGSWVAIVLAYGFAARLPVVIVMFLAIFLGWDSHYAKPRPDFPAMGHWGLFLWTALLPQVAIWIYLTVIGGMIFGALAVAVRGRARGAGAPS